MTTTLLIVAAALAVADCCAVHFRLFRLEYVFKPAPLAVLVAAAATSDLGAAKWAVVAALALGLAGDVALLLSDDRPDAAFLAGLGAFLLGHVAYLVAFARFGLRGWDVLAGALVAAGVAALALPAVLRGTTRSGGRRLTGAVTGYAAVLAAMTALAVGTGQIATAVGGVLFLGSDTSLARQRFVGRLPHGDLLVISTYHAAQFLILLGLLWTA